ncbi:hypothetical protein RUM43_004097 [Polyplax serrata]|uniref:Uncharacterized protein n=1 Tax=Polyplax serrata TaxID=468196 RepID=A0AAN8XLD2_POLSC
MYLATRVALNYLTDGNIPDTREPSVHEIYPVGKKQKKVCEKSEKLPPNKLKGCFNNLLPDTKQTRRKTNSQKDRKSPVTGGEEQSIFDLEETMGIHP